MRFVFFLFLACLNFNAGAQIFIKPKAGVNISHVKRSYPGYYQDNQVNKKSFHAGVALEIPWRNKLTWQAELLYSVKGYRDTTPVNTMSTIYSNPFKKYEFDFHYLELPLLVRYQFTEALRLGIGPSVSYLVGYEHLLHGRKTGSEFKITKFDYSLLGDISFSIANIAISARYINGLTNLIYREPYDPEFERGGKEPIGQNTCIQFSLSYAFKK